MNWTTACPDWQRRIVAGQSLVPCAPLFPSEAAAALDVYRSLKIVDAPGSPTIGEACRPWITDFAGSIFGAYDAESGRRLIRDFLLLVSKKNWKSGLAASIMVTALIRNWRQENEFLILAPTIEVANNAFGPAAAMVKADDDLRDMLHVQEHYRKITHRITGASLKVVAADNETVSGKKAAGVLIDELWLFGKRANAENMLREACGGLVSRPEGFVIYLSTMSDEPPAGVFKQKLNYFRDVRDGKIDDPKSLGVIYEYPEDMLAAKAYLDPANFYITNPNLGVSVDTEWMADELRKAQAGDAKSVASFAAKHLNVEIGLNLRSDRWAGTDFWEESIDHTLTLDALLDRCEVVVVGADGGGLDDLLGLAVLGREKGTGKWLLWSHAWAHRIVLERRKSEAPKLLDFENDGDLTIVDMPGEDVAEVCDIVCRIEESGLLAEGAAVGVDSVGIGDIVDELTSEARGIDLARIIGISQGYKLMGSIKTAERKLAGGDLIHAGRPMMAWCVGNAKIENKGNAVLITKQMSGTAKIDPLIALFNAVALMATGPVARGRSIYDSDDRQGGLLVI